MPDNPQPHEQGDKLDADPDALERWQQMPQGTPSRQAFAPAAGGGRWTWWIVGFGGLIVVVVLLLNTLA